MGRPAVASVPSTSSPRPPTTATFAPRSQAGADDRFDDPSTDGALLRGPRPRRLLRDRTGTATATLPRPAPPGTNVLEFRNAPARGTLPQGFPSTLSGRTVSGSSQVFLSPLVRNPRRIA